MKTSLENISDTARWVAYYRALETDRPDSLFKDPYARILAGEDGEGIVQKLPGGKAAAWPMIVRTHIMDNLILKAIKEQGVDTVINLAAGLDTRPFRLDLPQNLRWIEVDLPEIIAYKREKLKDQKPKCLLETRVIDLLDTKIRSEFFQEINQESQKVLVITEGFLVYLKEPDVALLAKDLYAQNNFNFWLLDYSGPFVVKYMMWKWGRQLKEANSQMIFAPIGVSHFKKWSWEKLEASFLLPESRKLNRGSLETKLWWLLSCLLPRKMKAKLQEDEGFALLSRSLI